MDPGIPGLTIAKACRVEPPDRRSSRAGMNFGPRNSLQDNEADESNPSFSSAYRKGKYGMFERMASRPVLRLCYLTAPGCAASSDDAKLTTALQKVLDRYLLARIRSPSSISAVSLTHQLLKDASSNISLAAGTTKYPIALGRKRRRRPVRDRQQYESLHVGRNPSSRGCRKTLDLRTSSESGFPNTPRGRWSRFTGCST